MTPQVIDGGRGSVWAGRRSGPRRQPIVFVQKKSHGRPLQTVAARNNVAPVCRDNETMPPSPAAFAHFFADLGKKTAEKYIYVFVLSFRLHPISSLCTPSARERCSATGNRPDPGDIHDPGNASTGPRVSVAAASIGICAGTGHRGAGAPRGAATESPTGAASQAERSQPPRGRGVLLRLAVSAGGLAVRRCRVH